MRVVFVCICLLTVRLIANVVVIIYIECDTDSGSYIDVYVGSASDIGSCSNTASGLEV